MIRWKRAWATALVFAAAGTASAATFTVTKAADTNDGACDADCSLREAIVAANASPGPDTIVLPAGTYVLTIADTNENASADGDLDITDDVTLSGAGAATTIIDGNNAFRVLHVLPSASSVALQNLTIRNGNAAGFGGGIHHEGNGALALTGATVTGNRSSGFGGGINVNNDGALTITGSTISNNTATQFGGGINNNQDGATTISGSTITGNTAQGFGGGGINNNLAGTLNVTQSTISGNTAQNGGGINNNNAGGAIILQTTIANNTATGSIGGGGILNNSSGTVLVASTTVSGNTTAGFGGGGASNNSGGQLSFLNSTVSGNAASTGEGGGLYNNFTGILFVNFTTVAANASAGGGRNVHANSSGPVQARNSIVGNPASGLNCGGTITSLGSNLASDTSCTFTQAGDVQGVDPLLGPLANNGGPTQTHGLCTGSPAVDSAVPSVQDPQLDQRGVARPQGAAFDKGSFEGTITCGGPVPALSINSVSAAEGNAGTSAFTFTVTLSAASATPVTVQFATADGTATAGSDYTAASGTLTFAPGVTSQPVVVNVTGDTMVEGNETFVVNLSNPSGATIAVAQGTGTITNDDSTAPPQPPPPAQPIPTLSEWALLLLALMLGGVAWHEHARRRGRR